MDFSLLSTEVTTFQKIFVIFTTTLVIILGISNLTTLCRKRKQIPFSNVSPAYLMFTFTALLINQIISMLSFFLYDEEIFLFLNLFNFIVLHGLIWLPLVMRLDDLYNSIKFNYYHITQKLAKKKHNQNYEKFFKTNITNRDKLNSYYLLHKSLPLAIYIAFMLILFLVPYLRCSLFYWIDRIHFLRKDEVIESCGIPNKYLNKSPDGNFTINNPEFNSEENFTKYVIADTIKNFINFAEIFVYILVFFLSKKFPYKNDIFLIFLENRLVLIVWLFFNDFLPFINLLHILDYSRIGDYLNNFLRIFFLFIIFSFLYYKRRKIRTKKFLIVINDFNNFINFPPFFKYFQEQLEKSHENALKYLDFWISFNILDSKIFRRKKLLEDINKESNYVCNTLNLQVNLTTNNNVKENLLGNTNKDNFKNFKNVNNKTNLIMNNSNKNLNLNVHPENQMVKKLNIEIKEKILLMYKKYFNSSGHNSCSLSDISAKSQFKIEFPVDMQEKVEEIIASYDQEDDVEGIFEESFNFVCHYLSNIHSDLIIKDREKLVSMLYVINFFDLNDDEENDQIEVV